MGKKKTDPELVRLMDRREECAEKCERWYRRLKAAMTKLEKERKRLKRIGRSIAMRQALLDTPILRTDERGGDDSTQEVP